VKEWLAGELGADAVWIKKLDDAVSGRVQITVLFPVGRREGGLRLPASFIYRGIEASQRLFHDSKRNVAMQNIIESITRRFSQLAAGGASLSMALLFLIVFINSVRRYAIGKSFEWGEELPIYIGIYGVMFGMAWAYSRIGTYASPCWSGSCRKHDPQTVHPRRPDHGALTAYCWFIPAGCL
jgi:hypothetical protein